MTDRWEAAAEAQIRTAQERGEFDNLPGMGKPLPGRNTPYDESWWIKSFLEREALPTELLLPTPLQLRRRIERIPDEVRDLPTEQAVRAYVGDLNAQVLAWLRNPTGPRVVVRPANADEVVRQWRAARDRSRVETGPAPQPSQLPRSRRGWWRPRGRRA
ncbi:DUF1992 domain-containing protein [Micromonospora sp. NBC_01405]|uniref:DnaJ family domain-containing protein n=1 Tax=Micromonospora sp. NBC_01405 TaxID=2903589 RepID=UPI00324B78ED